MTVVADTHVHIYPTYDRDELVTGAFRRLAALNPAADARILCLAERSDCHAFRELPGERAETNAVQYGGGWILAGRQVVTLERIEVLALTTDEDIHDGHPIGDTLLRIREAGGVPVLSWAPGKWFFVRGKIVRGLIAEARPGDFLLGDTSLRPTVWVEPALMRLGRQLGLKILAGSDPLPFKGEEARAGTYGIVADAPFDSLKPVTSMRAILTDPRIRIDLVGHRCGPLTVAMRLKKNSECRER